MVKALARFILGKCTKVIFENQIRASATRNRGTNLLPDNILRYNDSRTYGYKPVICYAPSLALYFNIYGDVLACCQNTKDILGNLQESSLDDIWNSTRRQQLQEDIRNYVLPEGCSSCQLSINNNRHHQTLARIYDTPAIFYGDNIQYPLDLTFEIRNTCNLECIMCNAEYSSTIRKNRDELPQLQNYYPDDFLDQLKPYLMHGKTFRFQGGEPFLIDAYLDIIEFVSEHNKSHKIYIQTNGTIYNNRVAKILSQNNIHLSISIDSLNEERYKSIRKNALLPKVLGNLKAYQTHLKKHKNTININICIMHNNWREIPDFIEFCHTNDFTFTFIMIEFPEYLSIINLGTRKIKEIKEFLQSSISDVHKKAYRSEYDSLLFTMDEFYRRSIRFETEIGQMQQYCSEELNEMIRSRLSNHLPEHEITKLLSHFRSKATGLHEGSYRIIIAKLICFLKEVANIEKYDTFKEKRLLNELRRYFEYEIGLLT
ncbi:MAG: radical SAM protein [Chitinophagales bacterium]